MLVTGSLYLLADLTVRQQTRTMRQLGERLSRLRGRRRSSSWRSSASRSAPVIWSGSCCSDGDAAWRQLADNGLFDFFSSGTWRVIRNLAIFFVGVFWLGDAFWVYKDARRRIEDPWLVGMATVLGLIPPFVGPLIYMLFRPPEYLEDVRERELEIKAMEERLAPRELHCPVCRAEVEPAFLVCPVCTTRLRQACAQLQAAARGALAGLPVLRDAGRADGRRAGQDAALDAAAPRSAAPRSSAVDSARRWRSSGRSILIEAGRDARAGSPARSSRASSGAGLDVRAARLVHVDRELAERHYAEHAEKPFFGELVEFITSGADARARARGRGGDRGRPHDDGRDEPGRRRRPGRSAATSRSAMPDNLVHGSDSPESAQREIALWFPDDA